jgi:Cof subfamily protein (haloacid dehalogenase superfamily)
MRAVFFDLDGTLLNQKHELSSINMEAVERLKQRGIIVCLASGRTSLSMRPFYHQLKLTSPLISYNGARIIYSDTEMDESPLPPYVVTQLIELAHEHEIHLNLYDDERWYAEDANSLATTEYAAIAHLKPHQINFNRLKDQPMTKALYIGTPQQLKILDTLINQMLSKTIETTSSMHNFLEVLSRGVNKGEAIKKVCQRLEIPIDEVMAFGDGLNDKEMIITAGHGVAMLNGRAQVKAVADAIAPHHADHGVAQYLDQYFNLGLKRSLAT